MIDKIEKILDDDVRPILGQHEGNVLLLSYENSVVKVKLTGKCSGCPSAYLTTEEVIRAKLMDALPEIRDVVLVNEVSEDTMDFARKLLAHKTEIQRGA